MSDENEEQLAINIIAKLTDLERQMKRAEAVTTRTYNEMQRNSTRATRQMETDMLRSTTRINQAASTTSTRVGALGRAFSVGLTAGVVAGSLALVAFSALIAKTKQALDEYGDISDKSAQGGVDAEFFQELTYQAGLAGVGMDELSSALNSFNKNSGLAIVNKGKMVTALKALNPVLLENIRNAKDQAERVKLAADAIDQAKTASDKAAIAVALFGDAGTKLVNVFQGGASALEQTAAKARELGIIIDNDVIASADDMGDKFDTATKIMDVQFKQALIALAPILVSTAGLAADLARGISLVIESMSALENRSSHMLEVNQGTNALQRLDIENKILDLKRQESDGTISLMDRAELADAQAKLDVMKKQDAQITDILAKRREAAAAGAIDKGKGDLTTLPPVTGPGASKTRAAAADDTVKQAEAVAKLIENLQFEQTLVGKGEVETAKMNALRQAGAAATDEQKKQIEAIIEATYREKAAHEANTQAIQLQKDMLSGAMTDIRTAFADGKVTAEEWGGVLLNMINKVADAAQQKLVDGLFSSTSNSGGLLSFLPSLFGVATSATGAGMAGAAAAARPAISPAARSSASAPQAVHVTVGLKKNGLNIEPEVVHIARGEAARAAGGVQKTFEMYRKHQFHKDWESHARARRVTGVTG